jgi:hypothetical protein
LGKFKRPRDLYIESTEVFLQERVVRREWEMILYKTERREDRFKRNMQEKVGIRSS